MYWFQGGVLAAKLFQGSPNLLFLVPSVIFYYTLSLPRGLPLPHFLGSSTMLFLFFKLVFLWRVMLTAFSYTYSDQLCYALHEEVVGRVADRV